MKRITALIAAVTIVLLAFSACTGEDIHPNTPVISDTVAATTTASTAQTTASSTAATTKATTAAPETTTSATTEAVGFTVLPEDGFDDAGFTMYVCETSGVYNFDCQNCGDEVKWTVYILDEEFEEPNRYIPQAEEAALEAPGNLAIEEGKYIYIHCNVNGFTDIVAPEDCCCKVSLLG